MFDALILYNYVFFCFIIGGPQNLENVNNKGKGKKKDNYWRRNYWVRSQER